MATSVSRGIALRRLLHSEEGNRLGLTIDCPKCLAGVGQPCKNTYPPTRWGYPPIVREVKAHVDRIVLARRMSKPI